MSVEKIIQKNPQGHYSISFRNNNGLSQAEIMRIFSYYGTVAYLGVAGDQRGYRFVHFTTREEAETAAAFAGAHNIKVLPHRPSRSSANNDPSQNSGASSTTTQWHRSPYEPIISIERPRGLSDGRNNQPVEENKKVVRNAAEIVVGNIHPNCGGAYFLYMFEKYQPIAISHVQVAPNTGMRYCHVYFKCQRDAEDVERDFDGCCLQGRKLIVMRPYTLMMANIMGN